jgi:SAM-dependent methyltransferase
MSCGAYRDWESIDYMPVIEAHYPDALIAELPSRATVLEIGCNDGIAGCYLATKRPDVFVHGIDINPNAVTAAQARAARGQLRNTLFNVQDALDPDLEGPYDAVLTIRVLTCFPEVEQWNALASTIQRLLSPRGSWYAVDYLFDPAQPAYTERYAAGERAGWRRGNFQVNDGSGRPLFVAHHHTEEELASWERLFAVRSLRRFESLSMNGNRASMFELLAGRRM